MDRIKPIKLSEEDVIQRGLQINTKSYPINKEQFELLINGKSKWKDYSNKFIWSAITLLIRILAICIVITIAYHRKQIDNISPGTEISAIDIVIVTICIIIALVLRYLSKYEKTPSDKLIEKVHNYFEQEL